MNPFLNKSPAELLVMVPDLADPELDALCAAVCDGECVAWIEKYDELMSWQFSCHGKRLPYWHWWSVPDYTSDPREAMRLLVKYRITVEQLGMSGGIVFNEHVVESIRFHDDPCCAITVTAVVSKLTRMIEAKPLDR